MLLIKGGTLGMLDISSLETFITVAQTGSFRKAADLLRYSTAGVAIQIRQLEAYVGLPLFDRKSIHQ